MARIRLFASATKIFARCLTLGRSLEPCRSEISRKKDKNMCSLVAVSLCQFLLQCLKRFKKFDLANLGRWSPFTKD